MMKNIFVTSMAALFLSLTACAPRDVAVDKSGNGTGGTIKPASSAVFDKAGTSPSNCKKDFSYFNPPSDQDPKIFAGTVSALVGAGDYNCYRIGAQLPMQDSTSAAVRGQVTIVKVKVIKIDDLTDDDAKALGMTLDALKSFATQTDASYQKSKNQDPAGFVSITYFQLVPGSFDASKAAPTPAPPTIPPTPADPTTPATTPTPVATGTLTITLIAEDGDRSPTCPDATKDYDYVKVTEDQVAPILAGQVTAALSIGDRNCYRVGATLDLKTNPKDTSRGQVIITQVEIVPVTKLNKVHAQALNMALADLKTSAQAGIDKVKNSPKPYDTKDAVNITFFVLAPPPAAATPAAPGNNSPP